MLDYKANYSPNVVAWADAVAEVIYDPAADMLSKCILDEILISTDKAGHLGYKIGAGSTVPFLYIGAARSLWLTGLAAVLDFATWNEKVSLIFVPDSAPVVQTYIRVVWYKVKKPE